jgi:Tyrosine-protein kinase ephrin type A/B receptor-like
MRIGLRRARRSRLLILVTLLLALGGAILTGTAGSASAATPCSAGTYFNGSSCVPAAPGYYVAVDGATSQTPCPVGSFQPNAGQTACEPATPGHFVGTVAAVSDTACPAGTYQPSTGQTGCIPASVNYYVPGAGSAKQLACPAGTDQPLTGQTSCIPVTTSAEAGLAARFE